MRYSWAAGVVRYHNGNVLHHTCGVLVFAGREVRALELQDVLLGRQQFRALSDAWFIQSAYVVSTGLRGGLQDA